MFFCEYCEIFKSTYFEEHLRTAASVITAGDSILTILQLFFQSLVMTLHKQIALHKKKGFPLTEAAVLLYSTKQRFLKVSQNLQEMTVIELLSS